MKKAIISLFIISFVLLVILLSLLFLTPYYFKKNDTTVPNVVGLNIDEALSNLNEFEYEIIYEYSNSSQNTVTSIFPAEGSVVKKNSKITVYVSKGINEIESFVGKLYEDVRNDIFILSNEIGFDVLLIYKDLRLEEGYVVDQEIDLDNKKIMIYISINNMLVDIPNFTGWSVDDVRQYEKNNNLNFIYIYEYDMLINGYVINQSISGRVSRDVKIVIYVSGIF